ncbi:ADP-ribosylation factor-like protein 2, partial [Kappamyces sp. JEL0680]
PDRLQLCKEELQALLLEERLAGATLMVYANKQDLPGALSLEQIAEVLGLNEIKSHHWHIEACSAYTGKNLLKGID